MPVTLSKTEHVDVIDDATRKITTTVDDESQTQQDKLDEVFAMRLGGAIAAAMGTVLTGMELAKAVPSFVPPRPFAQLPNGQVLTMGKGGEIYRDGMRLGANFASLIVQIGTSVLCKGKSNGLWYQWTGTGWNGPLSVDETLLTPPPPPQSVGG